MEKQQVIIKINALQNSKKNKKKLKKKLEYAIVSVIQIVLSENTKEGVYMRKLR